MLSEVKQGAVVRDLVSEMGWGEYVREVENELSREKNHYYELDLGRF